MTHIYKLTEREKEIIQNNINYLMSVELDEDDKREDWEKGELSALKKLLELHNEVFKEV